MTWVKWKLVSVCFDIVLISIQDKCTVCTERIIGSEICLDAPDVLLGDVGEEEARFSPFRNSVDRDTR